MKKIKNKKKNLLKNLASAIIGDSGSSLINIIFTIIVIKVTGATGYGEFIIALTFVQVIDTLINLQSWKGIIKYGQDALVNKRPSAFLSYIKTGYTIDIITAIIGTVITFSLANLLGSLFQWSSNSIISIKILSAMTLFNLTGTSVGYLRTMDKFHIVSIQKIMASFTRLLIIVPLLISNTNEVSIPLISIIYAISEIISFIFINIYILKDINDFKTKNNITKPIEKTK